MQTSDPQTQCTSPRELETGREYDFVIWGATGYTGKLSASYLIRRMYKDFLNGRQSLECRWALAGRNRGKLESMIEDIKGDVCRTGLGRYTDKETPPHSIKKAEKFVLGLNIDLIVVDTRKESIEAAITEVARRTTVLLTMVGPYAEMGEETLRACMASGTHYIDITAELYWMRDMLLKYSDEIKKAKIIAVCACGFDYTPNDLMMMQMNNHIKNDGGELTEIYHFFKTSTTILSGGTVASGLNMLGKFPLWQSLHYYFDPYTLIVAEEQNGKLNRFIKPHYDPNYKAYCVPFVFTSLMTKYVFWSNYVQGYPWGKNLLYYTGECHKGLFWAYLGAVLIWLQYYGSMFWGKLPAWTNFFPRSGWGPKSDTASLKIDLIASAKYPNGDTKKFHLKWYLDQMEAYLYASVVSVEAAMCLATNQVAEDILVNKEIGKFGFLPASATFGEGIIHRLQKCIPTMQVSIQEYKQL